MDFGERCGVRTTYIRADSEERKKLPDVLLVLVCHTLRFPPPAASTALTFISLLHTNRPPTSRQLFFIQGLFVFPHCSLSTYQVSYCYCIICPIIVPRSIAAVQTIQNSWIGRLSIHEREVGSQQLASVFRLIQEATSGTIR